MQDVRVIWAEFKHFRISDFCNNIRAYRAVDAYTAMRVRRWLQFKHKTRGRKGGSYLPSHLYEHFGLVHLGARERNLPWTKA
jgi:hypothetical protein